jgi:hypothetical protein
LAPLSTWICIDWPVNLDEVRAAASRALAERPRNAPMEDPFAVGDPTRTGVSMALQTERLWEAGRTIRVRYLGGEAWQQELVTTTAAEWSEYANIKFDFGSADPDAEIRVAFVAGAGSKSRIGTDCQIGPHDKPTMNLGWIDRDKYGPEELHGVILHEFGHALGCIHEHQSPAAHIPWDKEVVYTYYAAPPNNWTREEVDHNIFATYDRSMIRFSEFDPLSIMEYPIPEQHTIGDYHVDPNNGLSAEDKAFIAAAYTSPTIHPLSADGTAVAAAIGMPRQEDVFQLTVADSGSYVIETHGPTNVRMAIYGPDDPTRYVANDDDSGRDGYNARIETMLMAGGYSVRVQYQAGGPGDYQLTAQPA